MDRIIDCHGTEGKDLVLVPDPIQTQDRLIFFNCVSCGYFVCWQVAMSKFDKDSSINYERMAENLKIVRDRLDRGRGLEVYILFVQ